MESHISSHFHIDLGLQITKIAKFSVSYLRVTSVIDKQIRTLFGFSWHCSDEMRGQLIIIAT